MLVFTLAVSIRNTSSRDAKRNMSWLLSSRNITANISGKLSHLAPKYILFTKSASNHNAQHLEAAFHEANLAGLNGTYLTLWIIILASLDWFRNSYNNNHLRALHKLIFIIISQLVWNYIYLTIYHNIAHNPSWHWIKSMYNLESCWALWQIHFVVSCVPLEYLLRLTFRQVPQ